MNSVTNRIKNVKQPRGGYINPSEFSVIDLNDGRTLYEEENIHGSIVGMVVDYLTRYMIDKDIAKAFRISLLGAREAATFLGSSTEQEANNYLKNIKGLDDNSIINACKLVTFDVWFRNPVDAMFANTAKQTNPDKATVENIRTMVERSISFFQKYGPITINGFTFEKDGYTKTVSSGDGDFLTKDTLWDFKVTKTKLSNKNTLQLLMYWIMGQHSGKKEYENINKIGVFNPRLNVVYLFDMTTISPEIISAVEKDVICY